MQAQVLALEGGHHVVEVGKGEIPIAKGGPTRSRLFGGEVIGPQHHVLGGGDDRLAGGRREDVVAGQHQQASFCLGLDRQGHVHGHLVTVEVGVEGGTDQRVQLDGPAIHQLRLKGLNAQAVQGGGAV